MQGFQISAQREDEKRKSKTRAIPKPANGSGQAGAASPSPSKQLAVQSKPEQPKPNNFYTNKEGATARGAMPSSSRDVATTRPQKGGLPGNPKPKALPPPEAKGPTDFYSNSKGQTGRGFMPSSSRELVPVQGQKGGLPATVEPSKTQGKAPGGLDHQGRANAKTSRMADTAAYEAERSAQDKKFRDAKSKPSQPSKSRDQAVRGAGSKARGFLNKHGKPGVFGLALEPIMDGMEEDSTARYAERFNLPEPTGDGSVGDMLHFAALRGLGAASDMGSALTFGLADNLYRDKQETDTELAGTQGGAVVGGFAGNKAGSMTGKVLDTGARVLTRGRYKGDLAEKALRGTGTVVGAAGGAAIGGDVGRPEAPAAPNDEPTASTAPAAASDTDMSPAGAGQQRREQAVGFVQAPPQPDPAQQDMPNNVTRQGNSFSGGVIGKGFTVNGKPFEENINTAPRSPQNQQAVENLFARTPEFGEGPAAGFQAKSRRDNFYIGRDSSVQDDATRKALNAASTAYEGAQNGQLTANQLNTLRGIASDQMTDSRQRDIQESRNDAMLERTELTQQGQNQRTGARLALDERRLAGEQEARGFEIQQAQRLEQLRQEYQAAEDPAVRGEIAKQLQILSGEGSSKSDREPFKVELVEEPIDPSDPTMGTRQVPYVFDPNSGQMRPAIEGKDTPKVNPNHIRALQNNPETAAQFDEKYGVPGLSQLYLGGN